MAEAAGTERAERRAAGTAIARAKVMKSSSVFACLSDAGLQKLERAGSSLCLEVGAVLCHAGDAADAAFIILTGEIEVRIGTADGRETRLSALGAGALIGEMAVLDGAPRAADLVASRRTELWRIPRQALLGALTAEPEAALALIAALSQRLRLSNRAFENSRQLDLGGRLALMLLSEQNAKSVVQLTQTELARRLGHSREKVNRKLQEWAKAGWIEIGGGGASIIAKHELEAVAKLQ